MQIVINIPEEKYNQIINSYQGTTVRPKDYEIAIIKGTVLPKGHGDLIDRSKIYKAIPAEEDNCTGMGMTLEEMDAYNEGIDAMYRLVKGAKPIIEADKESEE